MYQIIFKRAKYFSVIASIIFSLISFSVNAQNWQVLGEKIFTGENGISSMTTGNNNKVYLAYEDPTCKGYVSIKKFNGKNWEYVGPKGISGEKVKFISIVLNQKSTPYVTYCTHNNKVIIKKFIDQNWVQAGMFNIADSNPDNLAMLFDKQNRLFIAFSDKDKQHLTVKKAENNKWEDAGINLPAGKSFGKLISLAVDTSNHIYLAYKDENNGGRLMVKKLQDNIWYPVGIFASENSVDHISFSVDNTNTPYVLYSESEDQKLNIKKFKKDEKGGKWLEAGNIDSIQKTSLSSMAIHSGVPYIAYSNFTKSENSIKKFDGTEWVAENKPKLLTNKKLLSVSLASDNRKNLYLLFQESNRSLTILKRTDK